MLEQEKNLKLRVNGEVVTLVQRKDMFCVSLDTILLTEFVKIKRTTKHVIDFGTNNGAIAILLALKYQIEVLGIEIQPEAVVLANKNVELSQLSNKIKILQADIKDYAISNQFDYEKKVDVIVCNPPFFVINQDTRLKIEPLKIAARHELHINLEQIIISASQLLKVKGKFFIIYDIQRIDQLLVLLKANNFMVKRMQFVYPKIDKSANLVLIEAAYATAPGMIVEPPLICHNEDGTYHKIIAQWYNKNKK